MSSSLKDRLSNIHLEIQTNVLHVHTNKLQCQRLSTRIDQLIDPLERLEHATSFFVREETRPILESFLQCLNDCNTFIEKFTSSTETNEEAYYYEDYQEKFEEFNQRLSQLGQDLCLGLHIQEIFHHRHREDLPEKITEISQKQFRSIDEMIDRRFQSFLHQLEKKLFIEHHSNQVKTFVHEQNQFLHIPFKDLYIEEKPIGTGGFADVYKGIWLTHHDEVAVKILRLNHLSDIRTNFYQEISAMYQIRYEHVLTFLGACIEPNFYAMIIEYMPLGSLYDILHDANQFTTLSWYDRYSLAWQMAKSINYLHQLVPCIIHRDIKSMNFLVKTNACDRNRFLLKVCDFGLAEIRRESLLQSTSSSHIVGSLAWKAPELFQSHEKHTKQTDVYSLGVTMWELGTGMKPWNEYTDESVIIALVQIGKRPTMPSDMPDDYQQAIEVAWNQDLYQRPSCLDLMERMRQQMRLSIDKKPVTTMPVDIHGQKTSVIDCDLINNFDSTRISVPVTEGNRSIDRLSNIIITIDQSNNQHELETSTSSLSSSENPPTIHRFDRLLSKSSENLPSESISFNDNSIKAPDSSKPPPNLHRSIIDKTMTSSNSKDNTQSNRHKSLIKEDIDSTLFDNRF